MDEIPIINQNIFLCNKNSPILPYQAIFYTVPPYEVLLNYTFNLIHPQKPYTPYESFIDTSGMIKSTFFSLTLSVLELPLRLTPAISILNEVARSAVAV